MRNCGGNRSINHINEIKWGIPDCVVDPSQFTPWSFYSCIPKYEIRWHLRASDKIFLSLKPAWSQLPTSPSHGFAFMKLTKRGKMRSRKSTALPLSRSGRPRGLRLQRPIDKISAKFSSFSAVSAPIFASKYAFFSSFQNLPNYLAEFFEIWQNLKFCKFCDICKILLNFHENCWFFKPIFC